MTSNLDLSERSVGETVDRQTAHRASKQSDALNALRDLVLGRILENNDRTHNQVIDTRFCELIPQCEPIKIMHLALDSGLVLKHRYTPLCVCVEMLKHPTFSHCVRDILPKVIVKVDMISDTMSLYRANNKAPINKKYPPLANSLRVGLSRAFRNFNEYQFMSARGNGSSDIKEIMFLVHPKPKGNQVELFKSISSGRLIRS